ncbi:hypothetical protein JXB28_06605 [Candidatus Woesearchaeota archaeon]|nr:hypothetical protein [Candidatus Woesearchaeota archaeon]
MDKSKKAQIITFDMTTTLVIFVIFIVIFIGAFFLSQRTIQKHEFELEYVFANLENNLRFDDEDRRFMSNYRIDSDKLAEFADEVQSIDNYTVGEINGAHGIGMDAAGYDTCLYFTDNDGTFIRMNGAGLRVLGELSQPARSCDEVIASGENPCEEYKQAISLFKPVLFDQGSPDYNRIVQMNIVICKK